MSKIIFVYPPVKLEGRYKAVAEGINAPPQGLCHLAAVVREKSFDVEIIDAAVLKLNDRQTAELILSKNPDYVGITAVTMLICNAARVLELIKQKNPRIVTMVGGPHITVMAKETMEKFPAIDIAVIGEGESTIVELFDALENKKDLSKVKGIAFRKGKNVVLTEPRPYLQDLDSIPIPAWDLLPDLAKNYQQSVLRIDRFPGASITTSRGCPAQCIFCARNVFGNSCRGYSAERVIQIIKHLQKNYGIKSFAIEDENFTMFKKRVREICEKIIEEKLDLSWSCAARVDMVEPEILSLMKKAGCWSISYGIESGSQRILDFDKKKITLERIERSLRWTKEAGIMAKGYFIIGHPTETIESIEETIAFAKKIYLDDFQMSFMNPFPGTELYDIGEKYGVFEKDWSKMNIWNTNFIPFGITEEQLKKLSKRAFREFYFRPHIMVSHILRAMDPRYFFIYLKEYLKAFFFMISGKD